MSFGGEVELDRIFILTNLKKANYPFKLDFYRNNCTFWISFVTRKEGE